jgi:hypothetical protein
MFLQQWPKLAASAVQDELNATVVQKCYFGNTPVKCKVVPVLNLIKYYAMKAYGGVDVWIHIFLTSALVGGEWSTSRPNTPVQV